MPSGRYTASITQREQDIQMDCHIQQFDLKFTHHMCDMLLKSLTDSDRGCKGFM